MVIDLRSENITRARELSNVKRFFFELTFDEFNGFNELAKQAAESSHGRKPVDHALYETPSPRSGRQIWYGTACASKQVTCADYPLAIASGSVSVARLAGSGIFWSAGRV